MPNYNLNRFIEAQKDSFNCALSEIKSGQKNLTGCGIFFRS